MMMDQIPGNYRVTVDDDKAYDCKGFVKDCRQLKATAHVAQKQKDSVIKEFIRSRSFFKHNPYRAAPNGNIVNYLECGRVDDGYTVACDSDVKQRPVPGDIESL